LHSYRVEEDSIVSRSNVVELAKLADEYISKSDDELIDVVRQNYDLTNAIVARDPSMAQDAGFELFDREWAKRYARGILAEISGSKGLGDQVYSWAMGASIANIATLIVQQFGVPASALAAAVALAVILVRAARAAHGDSSST
jgi:hypothetical protein